MLQAFVASYLVLWLVVVLQLVVLIGVMHAIRNVQEGNGTAMDGQTAMIGRATPVFEAVDVHGSKFKSTELRGSTSVLLFVSPSCSACSRVLKDPTPLLRRGKLTVICKGSTLECAALETRAREDLRMIADVDDRVSAMFHVTTVPIAVALDADGRVGSYGRPEFGSEYIDAALVAPASVS